MNIQETSQTKKDLDELSIYILTELKRRNKIESDLYTEFISLYAKRLFEDFSLSTALTELYDYCQTYYDLHFSRASLSPSEAVSALYSSFWQYLITCDLRKEDSYQKKLAVDFKSGNRMKILMIIDNNPGIIHKQLAEKANISPSALSQFVSKYQGNNLFSTIAAGREKAYYIELNGKRLLEKTALEKRSHISKTTESAAPQDISGKLKEKSSHIAELEEKLKKVAKREKELEAQLEELTQVNKELTQLLVESIQKDGYDSKRDAEEQIFFVKQSRSPSARKGFKTKDTYHQKDYYVNISTFDSKKAGSFSNSRIKKDHDPAFEHKELIACSSNIN